MMMTFTSHAEGGNQKFVLSDLTRLTPSLARMALTKMELDLLIYIS